MTKLRQRSQRLACLGYALLALAVGAGPARAASDTEKGAAKDIGALLGMALHEVEAQGLMSKSPIRKLLSDTSML